MPHRLAAVADRLRGVCVRHDDALKIVDGYDTPDCLLFVDPPYPGPVGRRYAVKMDAARHQALAERLARCRASVIMTMNPGTVYGNVLAGWWVQDAPVLTGGNVVKHETIMTNFDPTRAAQQGTFL